MDNPIRTFPWPYKAALTFSNDCDFLTDDAMLALHRLFNEPEERGGLDLDFSDSFFFFQNGSKFPNYSYFEGVTRKESRTAPVIRELLRTGHLDTLHGLGDFEHGGFRREHAKWALNELEKHDLRITVWSNHGGFSNRQNIGRLENCYFQFGDDIYNPFYILDILEDAGVRYYWTDTSKSKFMPVRPAGVIVTEKQRRAPRSKWQWPIRRIWENYIPSWDFAPENVFESVRTRSGAILQGFIRYDGFMLDGDSGIPEDELLTPEGRRAGPNIGRVSKQLTPDKLQTLVDANACAIIYQHFSTLSHLPRRTHISSNLEFHPQNLDALRGLKSYEKRGLIWLPSLSKLLDYLYMVNTSTIKTYLARDHCTITVKPKPGFEARCYDGLSVRVPENTGEAAFRIPGMPSLKASLHRDDKGTWAQIPITRLPKLDWYALATEANIPMERELKTQLLDGSMPVNLDYPGSL